MTDESTTLIVIATYNEIENLPRLTEEIAQHASDVDILVIDDNSPDGTGRWCDQRAASGDDFHAIHRSGKLGLGTATLAGLQYAIDEGYAYVLVMDADFSHHPRYLPNLLAGMESGPDGSPVDVMIGSRYASGGGVEGWPFRRRMMSRFINWYSRCLLGLRTRDCSGAFRCYRTSLLREIAFDRIRSRGYSYLEELLWLLKQRGGRIAETPIVFVDRQQGESKINYREAFSALWILFVLGMKNWFGRKSE
jgi:dolichol-phosphate mannosyltransferase